MGSYHSQQRSSDVSTGRNEVKWCELTLLWTVPSDRKTWTSLSKALSLTVTVTPAPEAVTLDGDTALGCQGGTTGTGTTGEFLGDQNCSLDWEQTQITRSGPSAAVEWMWISTQRWKRGLAQSPDFSGCWKCIKLLAWISRPSPWFKSFEVKWFRVFSADPFLYFFFFF